MNLRPHIRKVGGWWICSISDSDQYVGLNPVRAYDNWYSFVGFWLRAYSVVFCKAPTP